MVTNPVLLVRSRILVSAAIAAVVFALGWYVSAQEAVSASSIAEVSTWWGCGS